MKCSVCLNRKGKRYCIRLESEICSECCGRERDIRICPSDCRYMKQNYQRYDTSSIEITEVGRGKVILFSDSLFLPDIYKCFYCEVSSMFINIIEPTKILSTIRFAFKKRSTREASLHEAYEVDSWKVSKSEKVNIPFFQIYTLGTGKIATSKLTLEKRVVNLDIENNHVDTWLPEAYTKYQKLSRKEIADANIEVPGIEQVLVYYGEHFIGNNSTFFAKIEAEKVYELSVEIVYDNPQFEEKHIILPFGVFFPCELVNYSNFGINIASELEIDSSSTTSVMRPFADKLIMVSPVPLLEEKRILSTPQYVPYETNQMDSTFHYEPHCILYNHFKINLENKIIAKAMFGDIPILTGVYDSVNKVYEDKYAPMSVVICNNADEIRKFKIEGEIFGLSHKVIKEVYAEPYKVIKIHLAPKLIEDKVLGVTINKEYDCYVKVTDADQKFLYEETAQCLVYPREIFVDVLKNSTKDWKMDLKSFLARWVTSTRTEIDEIIAEAGKESINGIQGASATNNYIIQSEMKCIYDVLSKKIRYVARPLAFAEGDYHAQRVSLPSTTVKFSSGNCIDLSILLASCFEALKLHTFIVLIPGHAFVKVELPGHEKIYIESTYMGNKEYYESTERGRELFDKHFYENAPKTEGAFEIDLAIARKSGILPME